MRMSVPLLCLALGAGELGAQQMTRPQVGFKSRLADAPGFDMQSRFIESRTYWKEGGILGGLATLAVGMLLFFEAREGQSPPSLFLLPPAAAVSFLVGAGPGALIGGLIPKRE